MWFIYAQRALDIARDRQREAEAVALARSARYAGGDTGGSLVVGSRGATARRLVAAGLRRVEAGSMSIARSACDTATRLERPTA